MLRNFLIIAFIVCAFPIHAQQTKSSLTTEINSNFSDQAVGSITPAKLRQVTTDMVNSWQQFASVNAQTGTTYTFTIIDYGKLITLNNAGGVNVTLPQATGAFATFNIFVSNIGTGTATITPTISTINNASSFTLAGGQSVWIVSDGTNYQTFSGGTLAPISSVAIGTPVTSSTNGYLFYSNGGNLGQEQYATLGQGGLGGSQAAATAGQVPVFPGSGGPAVPTTLTVSAGTPQGILNTQTANYIIATTDCGKTIQAGTGSTGFFSITLPSVSGFASNCDIIVKNNDTARGKLLSGFPSDIVAKLYPLQSVEVQIINGAWASVRKPPRFLVTGSLTLYFDKDRGSDTNDCLAAGTGACATSAQVMTDIANNMMNDGIITIQMGCTATPCTYSDIPFQSTGYTGSGQIIVQGDTATPSNYIWTCASSCPGGAAFNINAGTGGIWTIQGFKFTGTLSTSVGIQIVYGSAPTVLLGKNEYGAFTNGIAIACIGAVHLNDIAGANYTISGGGAYFAEAQNGCVLHFDKAVGTLTGTPAFASAFLAAHGAGALIGTDNTHFSGAATGVQCNANLLGLVDTAGTAASLPGNSACTTATGGVVN